MSDEKVYVCGNCGHRWCVPYIIKKKLITCPLCEIKGKINFKEK